MYCCYRKPLEGFRRPTIQHIYCILFITDQRLKKKLVLKSITDLCYSISVIKIQKNLESAKKLDYTQINAS